MCLYCELIPNFHGDNEAIPGAGLNEGSVPRGVVAEPSSGLNMNEAAV